MPAEDLSLEAATAERSEIVALVTQHVRLRFTLDAATLAERLLALAGASHRCPEEELLHYVRRLSLDDLYLATSCVRGEEGAWEELVSCHRAFLRDFARRFLGEPEATDLADQVLADLWRRRRIARYEGRSTLRTWLAAVVANAALNAAKAGRRSSSLDGEERLAGPCERQAAGEPATNEARSLLARLIDQAIDNLAADEKLLLYLYYEQGLTLDQMTVVLGGSKAGLSRRLARVRSGLRAAIDELCRRSVGASAETLRAGLDLGHLELDFSNLLTRGRKPIELVRSEFAELTPLAPQEPQAC
jgi:RNA polymerase sigma-70 factor (ECF subfamily)